MSNGYDNTNSGFIADNQRRRNDKDPLLQGSINVEGVEYWVSAWQNVGKDGGKMAGKPFLSLKLRKKDSQPESQPSQPAGYDWGKAEKREEAHQAAGKPTEPTATEDFDDAIPFTWAYAVPFAGLLTAMLLATYGSQLMA